ncbi:MAG: polymer-forming cytoskeletal protein [Spirochaetaceae bacterium]|nr:polymer-forming cytoskeletal protein [Spirochaetaceae bacterium]
MSYNFVENGAFVNSIVGEGTRLTGELDLNGLLRIDGDFIGTIRTTGKVLIGKNGRAKCTITASTVVIGGALKGNIYASEKIIVLSSGIIFGNIYTPKLIVEEGVILDGNCTIKSNYKESIDSLKAPEAAIIPGNNTEPEAASTSSSNTESESTSSSSSYTAPESTSSSSSYTTPESTSSSSSYSTSEPTSSSSSYTTSGSTSSSSSYTTAEPTSSSSSYTTYGSTSSSSSYTTPGSTSSSSNYTTPGPASSSNNSINPENYEEQRENSGFSAQYEKELDEKTLSENITRGPLL